MFTQDSNSTPILTSKCVKNTLVAVGALLALFLLAKSIGAFKEVYFIGKSPAFQNIITVSGKAEVNLKPDIATFNFSVTEESASVATAQTAAEKKIAAIVEAVKKAGVEEKDIKTLGYSINPRYEYAGQYYGTGKRTLAGYTVSQTIEVKVRKIEEAGKLLTTVGTLGATDVSGLSFDVENREEVVKNARAEAIANAKAEADRLVRDLGVKIVSMTSFSEGGFYPISPMYYGRGGDMMASEAAVKSATVPVGENKIVSTVTISYEIK